MHENIHVAFYIKKFNSAQQNYITMDKELLFDIEIEIYHMNILFGFKIHLHSDYQNLSF